MHGTAHLMDDGPAAGQRAGQRAGRAGLAWALCLVCFALVVTTALLTVLNGLSVREAVVDEGIATICVLSISFSVVGALIAARWPENPIGWVYGAAALLQVLIVFAEQYAIYVLLTRPGSMPYGPFASWLKEWVWAPGLGLIVVLLPLLFPTGRPPSRPWWAVAWLGALAVGLIAVMGAVAVWPHRGEALLGSGGEAEYELAPAWGFVTDWIAFPLLVAAGLGAVASLVVRFRRASERERRQILWLTVAAALSLGFTVASEAAPANEGAELAVAALGLLVVPSIPVATGVAILRHRLYDMDLVLDRTLMWGGLATAVVAFYVVVVGTLGAVLQAQGDVLVSLAATGLVAVAFAPLRDRLQRAVNRLVYGQRDEPYAVLSRLSQRLETAQAPYAVLPTVADAVASALKLPYVAVEVMRGDGCDLAARVGRPVGEELRLPLVYGSETVGALVTSQRTPGEPLGPADRRLLADLARHVGVAVHAVRLTEDLQRSRERLVMAREEERRRLRRDLHDGLGPALSSSILKIAAARRQLPAGSSTGALLAEVREDLRGTVAEIRSMAHDLRPPALDQVGLVGALEDHASAGLESNGMSVAVAAAAPLPPLPAAVEVAAYLIAREALSNAVRHSAGSSALVRVAVTNGAEGRELRLEVTDDGHGIPAGFRAGVGLASMRERAEELGGTLVVDASSAGTRVLARLPVGKEAS